MGNEWKPVSFSDVVDLNPKVKITKNNEYPFVDMKSIDPAWREVTYSELRTFENGGSKFLPKDTLMARITPCLENGKIARYMPTGRKSEAFGSTEFIVIRGKNGVTDNDYVYYLTTWSKFRDFAISQMTGSSGRQRVPVDSLSNFYFNLPPLTEQKSIAYILGSLDDKIELNRRMNETLEAMAQALFKSWFVDFDPVIDNALAAGNVIPEELRGRTEVRRLRAEETNSTLGSGGASFQNLFPACFEYTNEMGWIPAGWEISTSGKLFDVRDGTHDSPKQSATGKYLITSRHITGNTIDFSKAYLISDADFEQVNKRSKVDCYDILITMIGTVGVPFLVLENEINFAIKNIGLFKTCTNRSLSVFFYLHLKTVFMTQFLKSRMAGTTQEYLTLEILRKLPLLNFPSKLLKLFGKEILPIFDKIYFNNENCRYLKVLRDSLLPQLLSGEIRIPEAEKQVEDLI